MKIHEENPNFAGEPRKANTISSVKARESNKISRVPDRAVHKIKGAVSDSRGFTFIGSTPGFVAAGNFPGGVAPSSANADIIISTTGDIHVRTL